MKEVSPDLVERLRGHLALQVSHPHFSIIANDCYAAADAIVTLQAEKDKHTREFLDHIRANVELANLISDKDDAITALQAERDAEKLKRLQVEHERDCILEDLVAAIAAAKA